MAFLLKIVCEFRGNNVFGTQDSEILFVMVRGVRNHVNVTHVARVIDVEFYFKVKQSSC